MELDKDLLARQEARALIAAAQSAQTSLAAFSQGQLDAIVEAITAAFSGQAAHLAELAVKETGFGNVADKITKNRFASLTVSQAVRGMKTVGVLSEKEGLWEIGVPKGVIAAIVPSTNPTSTVCYKAIIALKAGCAIVFSPHPKAANCTREAVAIVSEAARNAGAPAGSISCLSVPSMEECRELMGHRGVGLILATGGPALVKAAYSSGRPAIGVGAGNGPAYIHPSADMGRALDAICRSKTFDNGTVCASEQSIVIQRGQEKSLREEGERRGYYFLEESQAKALGKLLFRGDGTLNPQVVGKTAIYLAELAGFSVPKTTKILVARETSAGTAYPYSMEKLCPVLALYVMENEEAVLDICQRVLGHEGAGHTFSIHAEDKNVIRRFAERIPVSRFLVNTPAALGGVGLTTKLFPALTLGCGAIGGSSSSNNVSPMDLIDIRRVAWNCPETAQPSRDLPQLDDLVELLTEKILKRLDG